MPTEAEQYDTLVANLRKRLARGGMSYAEAVILDDIISILVSIQSEAAGNQKRQTDQSHKPIALKQSGRLMDVMIPDCKHLDQLQRPWWKRLARG